MSHVLESAGVSIEHYIIKAAAQALRTQPRVNVAFAGDSLHMLSGYEVALEV